MQTYKAEISDEEKEQTIRDFLPFIKYTASRLLWRLPLQLTIDDLISVGIMGLMDALQKYDNTKGKLRTFAEFRIKGAMLDELRSNEWMPRSVKDRINGIKTAHRELEKELGRFPEDEEIASALDISLDEYYRTINDANSAVVLRLEDFDVSSTFDENIDILECIADPNARNPLSLLEDRKKKEMLAELIDQLSEKERLLLSLYYWEEMTMKEIGRVMKLTEGRVCQMHSRALIRLKSKLADNECFHKVLIKKG